MYRYTITGELIKSNKNIIENFNNINPVVEYAAGDQFADKTALQTAVDLWISDKTSALSTYGEINTWDTSLVTNMAELFKEKDTLNKKMDILRKKKDEAQPTQVKTGGSTFKNPINQTNKKVWELIKSSVPKNITFGDATISEKHFNFFINKNKATFKDMKKLIDFVKSNVKEKTGINLDLEIEIIE